MNADACSDPAASRPGLLVSVRNAFEARIAAECGADLIDVKEPLHGPLGRAAVDVLEAAAKAVGTARPVSIALGELVDLEIGPYAQAFELPQVRFAKIGLARTGDSGHWWQSWEAAWSAVPDRVARVGVIYVDWQRADAPRPDDALRVFAGAGCGAVLFDTYTKRGQTLLDCTSSAVLDAWIAQAREAAPVLVLAGSLTIQSLGLLTERGYRADYIGIRGAACRKGRDGTLSRVKLRHFTTALRRISCIFGVDP